MSIIDVFKEASWYNEVDKMVRFGISRADLPPARLRSSDTRLEKE